jgi:hypothetical protein
MASDNSCWRKSVSLVLNPVLSPRLGVRVMRFACMCRIWDIVIGEDVVLDVGVVHSADLA